MIVIKTNLKSKPTACYKCPYCQTLYNAAWQVKYTCLASYERLSDVNKVADDCPIVEIKEVKK